MQVLYAIFLLFFALVGIKLATIFGPFIESMMSYIWVDPSNRYRSRVVKRVKELCVDGDVPDETAVLVTSKEMNLTEKAVNDALGAMTPATMRTLSGSGLMSDLLRSMLKVTRKVKGAP
jgi:hypothetical protein